MIFNTYHSEKEIARLMSHIPNFRPRGHGTYILNRFEFSAEDCSCKNCLHYFKKVGCTEQHCPYITERITAGAVPICEVLSEAFSAFDHLDFRIRLLQYIHESEENTMPFKNDKHQKAFTEAVRKMNKKDNALMAWDNGQTLAVNTDEDSFHVITGEKQDESMDTAPVMRM